ncbi:MAG: cobalt transporter CbiM [Syntrophobacterales bacterium]|nr:cobalt transporter CbiM [Syntrophobacterales bacterium]
MHIADGVLPTSVTVTGYILSGVILAFSLRRISYGDYPKIALMSSAFFVASLVHVPIGPSSVHLLLPGVVGIVLGSRSFIATTLGLILQCFLFQFGGITALGANALMMGIPALLTGWLFHTVTFKNSSLTVFMIMAGISGMFGVLLAGLILALLLFLSGSMFYNVAKLVLVAHIPVAIIEGIVAIAMVSFLRRTKPEIFSMKM